MGKCIGTSIAQFVDIHSFPRVRDELAIDNGYNNHAGEPGYGMGVDGRKGKRRLELYNSRAEQLNSMADVQIAQGVVGRSTTDGRWPLYTEILDTLPDCS